MPIRFRHTVVWLIIFWAMVPALVMSIYLLVQFNSQALEQGQEQLVRENRQLSVESERLLFQIQNQLIRLSEQGAIVKSATVSFLSQKATDQMEDFRTQFPIIDSVVLLDNDQFPMEVTPSAALKVNFSSLEDFITGILLQRYNLTLESASPRFKFFYNPKLAELSQRDGKDEYLAVAQPVIRITDSLSQPYVTDGVLLVTLNLDALVKQLAASSKVDLATTNIAIKGDNFTLFKTPIIPEIPFAKTTEALDYSLLETNPHLFIEIKRSWTTLKSNVESTIKSFTVLLAVFMTVVIVLASIASRILTRPIRLLQRATSSMAEGKYEHINSFSNFKEFQELTDLMSTMGETIQFQFAELNSAKLDLENKVNNRTTELQNSINQLSLQGDLLRGLMQVTVDMQRSPSIDALLDCSLLELTTQFNQHKCGILLNRNSSHESYERFVEFSNENQVYLRKHLNQWRDQDFDFRIDQYKETSWTLIPIRNTKRMVIGQILMLGPVLTDIERDVLFILTRLLSTMLDQLALTLKLERLANTDALTGLANRHFFENQLKAQRKRWSDFKQPIGLIVIDVDNLKEMNDKHGHEYGDSMIQKVADQLQTICRESDILARMGGDEFYILLNDADLNACEFTAQRLKDASENLYLKVKEAGGFLRVPISFSLGFACSDQDPIDSLVKLADKRMYAYKHEHRTTQGMQTKV
jgi:diguanylate cyclase (GGDEF)-like protein